MPHDTRLAVDTAGAVDHLGKGHIEPVGVDKDLAKGFNKSRCEVDVVV